MAGSIQVLIAEDDHFSNNWMALLLARDWRTHVTAQVSDPGELRARLANPAEQIDLVLLDTEMPGDAHWMQDMLQVISARPQTPRVLLTGTYPQEARLRLVPASSLCGYILKSEIRFGLAWAAALAMEWKWVITPGVETMLHRAKIGILRPYVVLDGRVPFWELTEHQTNAARLAFLFSMERRELADELGLTEDWVYGLVSSLYKKLGLSELLSGEVDPQVYWGEHPLVLSHVRQIIAGMKQSSAARQAETKVKARDLETLAFHLLTMPEVREVV